MKQAPRKRFGVAGAVLAAMIVMAALAQWLAPYAPDALDLANRRAMPSIAHWFGTDELGRDLFSRVLYGARVSLAVGLLSALVAGVIGIGVGATSATAGHVADAVLMRLTDAVLSVPRLLLLMVAAAVLDPSIPMLVLLVGMVGWMETARVTRASLLTLREQEFVMAAQALGASTPRVVLTHLLPRRGAGDSRVGHACRWARHPARVGPQLLRHRRPAPCGQLGQHALSGADDNEHGAVAGALPGRVHLRDGRRGQCARREDERHGESDDLVMW